MNLFDLIQNMESAKDRKLEMLSDIVVDLVDYNDKQLDFMSRKVEEMIREYLDKTKTIKRYIIADDEEDFVRLRGVAYEVFLHYHIYIVLHPKYNNDKVKNSIIKGLKYHINNNMFHSTMFGPTWYYEDENDNKVEFVDDDKANEICEENAEKDRLIGQIGQLIDEKFGKSEVPNPDVNAPSPLCRTEKDEKEVHQLCKAMNIDADVFDNGMNELKELFTAIMNNEEFIVRKDSHIRDLALCLANNTKMMEVSKIMASNFAEQVVLSR